MILPPCLKGMKKRTAFAVRFIFVLWIVLCPNYVGLDGAKTGWCQAVKSHFAGAVKA